MHWKEQQWLVRKAESAECDGEAQEGVLSRITLTYPLTLAILQKNKAQAKPLTPHFS